MDYSELPIEERMKHAKNYAFLLRDELHKTPEMIIDELSSMFYLPINKAKEAYLESINEDVKGYKKNNTSKLIHLTIVSILFIALTGFYLFLSKEVGWFFYIMAFLFGLSFIVLITLIYQNIKQSLLLNNPNFGSFTKKWYSQTLPFTFIFFVIAGWSYWFNKNITINDIAVIKGVLVSKITLEKSGGKNSTRYYNITLKGIDKNFRFYRINYKYCFDTNSLVEYNIGDSIEIEIKQKDSSSINNSTFFANYNQVIGYGKNGKTTINYELRYKEIKQQKEIFFLITLIAFGLNILIFIVSFMIKD